MKITAALLLFAALIVDTALAAAPPAEIMAPFELEQSGGGLRMKVRVSAPSNGCTWGDLDAIQLEMKSTKTPRLLVSVEALGTGGGTIAPVTTDISSFDLEKGFVTTFVLPKFSKPANLVFYLCKDSDRKGKCAGKPAVRPQTVLQSYLTPLDRETGKRGPAPEEKEASDKIYYYAYVLVNGSTGYTLKNNMDEPDYAKLGEYLKSIGVTPDVAKAIRENNDAMDSVQPAVVDDVLTLSLPRLEKDACPKPEKK